MFRRFKLLSNIGKFDCNTGIAAMNLFIWPRKHRKNSWYQLYLTPSQVADYEQVRLELAFETAYIQARRPRHMNLWMDPDARTGTNLYISPASRLGARQLIVRYAAQACSPPLKPLLWVAGFRNQASAAHPVSEPARVSAVVSR